MGKTIVIKGADFSSVAVGQVDFTDDWQWGVVFYLPTSEDAAYTVTMGNTRKYYKNILFGRQSIKVSWKATDPIHVLLLTWRAGSPTNSTSTANYPTDMSHPNNIPTTVVDGVRSFTFNVSSFKAVEIVIIPFDYTNHTETGENMETLIYDENAITVEIT